MSDWGNTLGMHFGLVAVKADVKQLVEAFPLTWPQYEVTAAASLDGLEQLWRWQQSNERSVSGEHRSKAGPGAEVFEFWQDGPWAIMMDPSYVQASDENALAALSIRFGLALSFVIETSGGCAYFWCFKEGGLLRSVQYADGKLVTRREPMEEESGMRPDSFYMEETEELQKRFGITPPEQLSEARQCEGLAVIDRTDYSALLAAKGTTRPSESEHLPPPLASMSGRPWWKFW